MRSNAPKNAPRRARQTGLDAERCARVFLESQGLSTIASNYRTQRGEIDLVMQDADLVIFVEVRSRTSALPIDPAATVDRRKQQRVIFASLAFLQERRLLDRAPCRFDVVTVLGAGEQRKISWIKNAFEA